MGTRREVVAFCLFLAMCVGAFLHESLFLGKVLSPADVLFVSASFRGQASDDYEPHNRLLMDPVLQFQPWLEFNRRMVRSGRLPLWNSHAGCGAPHLANGQSAVFDPFHLLAYCGSTPGAYAWIAASRLWVAGLGMFLLARLWGLGFWGRWFAGLVYPFCGFLVLWLLYPVTAVAIWMPWLFFATDAVFERPRRRAAGWLALVVAAILLSGHIQTSAHVLMAGASYAVARLWWERANRSEARRTVMAWISGTILGIALAAVQVLPLGAYLAKSRVWGDRQRERSVWWSVARPRLLEAVCTGAPDAYGSQRRGQPNLARAVGVQNLNESAGGFAGLATLIWLAPLAVIKRPRTGRVVYLTGLVAFGALGSFRLPPVDNLLRALPILEVTDNRRLTLWVAFGLTLLGGMGLDRLGQSRGAPRGWRILWIVAGLFLASLAASIGWFEPCLRERAVAHYRAQAELTPGADATAYSQRAIRQVREALEFLPAYYAFVAGELGLLAVLAWTGARARVDSVWIRPGLLAIVVTELAVFGVGLNPAIARDLQGFEPVVITRLRQALPSGGRALGLGEELPPNVLARFGLSDVRNYDSVELARNLEWLAPLYEHSGSPPSSRGKITWDGVIRARSRLLESGVGAVVAAVMPPKAFESVERAGRVWIAWLKARPWIDSESRRARISFVRDDGRALAVCDCPTRDHLVVRETWDPGWSARLDGKPVRIEQKWGVFLRIELPAGRHELFLKYDPMEVRVGLFTSACALVFLILVLTGIRLFWIPGISRARGLDGPKPPS